MRLLLLSASLSVILFSTSCSEAQNDDKKGKGGKKKDKQESLENNLIESSIPGLRKVGALNGGVPESSGLARAETAGTFYTHADAGNQPVLYKIDMTGRLLGKSTLPFSNVDWESLAQDDKGNIFIVDAGNNNNSRSDLVVYRINPASNSQDLSRSNFSYADQTAFPPGKKERNFDCEASLWYGGKLYLFTKDRGARQTSKVYTLSDQPGNQKARLLTKLAIAGEVTGADVSSDGHRIALLAREELFMLEGNSFEAALKATPRRISLKGAGQTEGIVFHKDDNNKLFISTEEGNIYEYSL
ncbi:hypothetical protein [Hymenobacter cellulosivorans]|uniref:Esterase-like activity of phytase family protein n=1 Tax=Hymenobacter cellulosivorans TaxID=2932249 RepID=A0ABY4FFD1_9BACT|nr:hypothetical protein [Hymenobacter cellulosivorans]UOQ55115.1 hypothetical protein MUN80_10230 [Hymenobacter cellulosivorans]